MSQSLRNSPLHVVDMMVQRRLKSKTMGLGYWSAKGYEKYVARQSRANMHKRNAELARAQMIEAGVIKPVEA